MWRPHALTNITQSGYFDESPRWVLDGNAILFASERYGMRNHASWGSMYDVMIVFLNQKLTISLCFLKRRPSWLRRPKTRGF